jgi:hypothetical protein
VINEQESCFSSIPSRARVRHELKKQSIAQFRDEGNRERILLSARFADVRSEFQPHT